MFGVTTSHGFLLRHVNGIELNNVQVRCLDEDFRPAFVLDDVTGARLNHVRVHPPEGVPSVVLKDVEDFRAHQCEPFADVELEGATAKSF